MPRILIFAVMLLALIAPVPFLVIAWSRSAPSEKRPIHIVQDMDFQPRFEAQTVNPLFADNRGMRPDVAGTVPAGMAGLDTHLTDGVVGGEWANALPTDVEMSLEVLNRGRQRFEIYCALCHGYAGFGDGIVNERALELMNYAEGPVNGTSWVQAKSLHDETVRDQPLGQIYNTITHGIRNMAGYGAQISVRDRWAIAAYVKALQRSQDASLQDVPAEQRGNFR